MRGGRNRERGSTLSAVGSTGLCSGAAMPWRHRSPRN